MLVIHRFGIAQAFVQSAILFICINGSSSSSENLISELQRQGIIKSLKVAAVMKQVDRADFCPSTDPYIDAPADIGFGATISAPHMHAYALEASLPALVPGSKVLDVGSGSGYLSTCYAELAGPNGRVIGIDNVPELVAWSKENVKQHHKYLLENRSLQFFSGKGQFGFPKEAPYDVIHVGAGSTAIPKELVEQLKPNGILIIPVGRSGAQKFMRIYKDGVSGELIQEDMADVRYVPLTGKINPIHT